VALNRYAYALNNPLRLVDPGGHLPQNWDPAWAKQFEAAHEGQAPTELDWIERQISLATGRAWSSLDWRRASGLLGQMRSDLAAFVGTPREALANVLLSAGSGELAALRRTLYYTYETGNLDIPIRTLSEGVPTELARFARGTGAIAGGALALVDLIHVDERQRSGPISVAQAGEDAFIVAVGGAAAVVIGLSSLPVWVAVGAGLLIAGVVGASERGVDTGDWSASSLFQGAESVFSPLPFAPSLQGIP